MAKRRRHGEGSCYQRADGKWVGIANLGMRTDETGARRRARKTVIADTEREALRRLRKILNNHEQGIRPTGLTVDKWITRWLDNAELDDSLRPKTLRTYRQQHRLYISPHVGTIKLDKLTPEDVEDMQIALRKSGKSTTTIQHAHRVLQRALQLAMQRSVLSRNVAAIMGAPDIDDNPHEILTADEVMVVLKSVAADPRLRARMAVGFTLALRPAEVLGLQWGDLTLAGDGGTAKIERGVQRISGKGLVVDELKTDRSHRVVPLPSLTALALAAWQREQGGGPTDFVFHGHAGTHAPEDPRRDYDTWGDALKAAGVKHVPPYGGRGTSASMLMALGVSDRATADILGHTTVKTTQRHYLRSDEAQRAAAMAALGAALSPAAGLPAVADESPPKDVRLKMPAKLIDRIDDLAADADVSRAAWIAEVLTQAVAEIERRAERP